MSFSTLLFQKNREREREVQERGSSKKEKEDRAGGTVRENDRDDRDI